MLASPNNDDILDLLEQESFNEEQLIEDYDQLSDNTPDQIAKAVSKNAANIFVALSNEQAAEIEAILANEEYDPSDEDTAVPSYVASALADYSDVVGDWIGNLVVNGLNAFRDAQANGTDAGAAVGAVLAQTIKDLNNSAKAIGDAIQEITDETIAMTGGDLDNGEESFGGLATERLISSLSGLGDQLGDITATAVNNAVSQGGNAGQVLGATFKGILDGLGDSANEIARTVAEDEADAYEGLVSKTTVALVRAQARTQVKNNLNYLASISGQVEQGIVDTVNGAVTGSLEGEGPAKNTVDVINRVGNWIVAAISQGAGI